MAESDYIRRHLNSLATAKMAATIHNVSFGWATLFRYEPLLKAVAADMNDHEKFNSWLKEDRCYVFEIGLNCGDVFSASMVKTIEITENGAIIHLKG